MLIEVKTNDTTFFNSFHEQVDKYLHIQLFCCASQSVELCRLILPGKLKRFAESVNSLSLFSCTCVHTNILPPQPRIPRDAKDTRGSATGRTSAKTWRIPLSILINATPRSLLPLGFSGSIESRRINNKTAGTVVRESWGKRRCLRHRNRESRRGIACSHSNAASTREALHRDSRRAYTKVSKAGKAPLRSGLPLRIATAAKRLRKFGPGEKK